MTVPTGLRSETFPIADSPYGEESFIYERDVRMMLAQFKERHHVEWVDGEALCSECRSQQWPCRTAKIVARWTGDDLSPERCTHWL